MKGEEKDRGGLQQSFLTGVIALVFLLVGYQTALLVHRAAVVKIAANRDEPDTVYVYIPEPGLGHVSSPSPGPEQPPPAIVQKTSSHSLRAQNVRRNLSYDSPQSFRFDPNTASVEDFCRLGFSQKQAQAIDAYRRKGGRFHRKEDFAKSYVVADSVYRRLEAYIDIPFVDLNVADSAAFDALPGIGGWYASKMVEYRKLLGGYSYKEQLMEIYRFDQRKYDALKDLITISTPYLYPLWELPADSLRKHPYIKSIETANSIVRFREHNPPQSYTVENLCSSGIITAETATKLSRCVNVCGK